MDRQVLLRIDNGDTVPFDFDADPQPVQILKMPYPDMRYATIEYYTTGGESRRGVVDKVMPLSQ